MQVFASYINTSQGNTNFEEAMKKIRPLSTQELKMYERISEEFGRPEIGIRGRSSRGTSDADISSSAIT